MKEIELKVIEAEPKDMGRAIARIDPDYMRFCEISAGDIVEIQGKKCSVARIMPSYPNKRGNKIIQIDGIVRENTGVGLGDSVKIKKASYEDAVMVVLSPRKSLIKPIPGEVIRKTLEAIPIIQGDLVRVFLFGTQTLEFAVEKIEPEETAVVIRPQTEIRVKGQPQGERPTGACYEDVGGLRVPIQRIREMVELPLRHPEVFERLGIKPPRGILLHGPKGCGKTLMARAVAHETDAYFISISGPEIMVKWVGESAERVRQIFQEAESHAPSIIFIDEIDAMAPKREGLDVGGAAAEQHKNVVAQLLTCMDGLKERGQVLVIGATNIPNELDPAIRRPGRFDREIEISVPDANGREEILGIHSRGMPLAEDVSIKKLAKLTHGYSGADLEALCREAAMIVLRPFTPKIEKITTEDILALTVKMDDFLEAMREVHPSLLREIFAEISGVGWENVGGLEGAKRELKKVIELPLKSPHLFKIANVSPPKGIMLSGPPGTGKTLLAKAVAQESGVNFISVRGATLLSRFIGESEKAVAEVFKKCRQCWPCVLFIDEMDAVAPIRGRDFSTQVTERVVSQLLVELDGIEELKGVVVLCATNRPELIDPALLRSGRIDLHLELPLPNKEDRIEIFKIHTREKPLAKDVDLEKLAGSMEEKTGADIEKVCRAASLLAIEEFAEKAKKREDASKLSIEMRHFEQALKSVM